MALDDGESLRAVDPGQDLHEWESARASLEEEADSSPDACTTVPGANCA